jgi:hippurate hydrolase
MAFWQAYDGRFGDVVIGHTPGPELRKINGIVMVDTGACYGGDLTAYCPETGLVTTSPGLRSLPDPLRGGRPSLGARDRSAQALASQPDFAGTVHFIFQPAEENEGGARAMIEDGLFQRFPMQAVYSLHNWPGLPVGTAAVHSEAVMAAFDIFDLTLTGQGCHAAMPHLGKDALLAACQLVTQLPALIAREQEVHKPAVLSITSFHAGDTYNVMPEVIKLRGTVRCFDMAQRARIEQRLRDAIVATCTLHGLQADLDYRVSYPATINHPVHAEVCAEVLAGVLGAEQVRRDLKPSMASEDFSFMAQACPGVYIWMGNGEDSASLHNPKYDFNDRVLPLGVQYFVQLVRALLRDGRLPATG